MYETRGMTKYITQDMIFHALARTQLNISPQIIVCMFDAVPGYYGECGVKV